MPTNTSPAATLLPAPALGPTFATVPVAPAVAVQLAPQANPLGQHPPLGSAVQLYHPTAQDPVAPPAAAAEALEEAVWATTVTPLLTTPVLADAGHEVEAQSRPTRQQPPW